MLLHRRVRSRDTAAEIADGALTVESPQIPFPALIAEREKQPVCLFLALKSSYNHMVVGYTSRRRCQSDSANGVRLGRLSLEAWRREVRDRSLA